MALIEIVNVDIPNSGNGDPLRISQVKANDNFAELNAKKVEIVAGFDLSENNFTDVEKTKLAGIQAGAEVNVQANWNQTDPSADDYIIGKPTNGKIITYGAFSLVSQTLTFFAGWVWQINDIIYTNSTNVIINFPYTSTGTQRLDLVVFNTLNSAERVEGDESISSPIAPLQISDTVLFSVSLISDSTVGTPTIPTDTETLKTYVEILTANKQVFTMPTGTNIEQVFVNESPVFNTTNVGIAKRYSPVGNVATIIAPTTVANNRIIILYR